MTMPIDRLQRNMRDRQQVLFNREVAVVQEAFDNLPDDATLGDLQEVREQLDKLVQQANTQLDAKRVELMSVRTQIKAAYKNTSISIDGHSLSRQSIETLERRESKLTWEIQEILQGGPFGEIIIEGRYDNKYYTRAQES